MRVTKRTHLDFDYLDTIQKINKMQGSPRYLSKENLPGNKNPNSIISKDSILNNIPIKVRLIRAAELNPNINLGKIRNLNRNSKTLKKPIKLKKRNEKDNSHTPCGSPNECIRTEVCTFQFSRNHSGNARIHCCTDRASSTAEAGGRRS